MKYAAATLLALGSAVLAQQELAGLSPCGQLCVSNMLAIAQSDFGCAPADVVCYCTNINFGYGVRDCSFQACSPEDAAAVVKFGTDFCANALAAATTVASDAGSALSVLSSAAATLTGADSEATGTDGEGAGSVAIATTPLVATISTDGTTILSTTGFETIFGPVPTDASATGSDGTAGTASQTGDATGTEESTGDATGTDAEGNPTGESTGTPTGGDQSSTAGTAGGASSTAAAAFITAAPMLGAAAMGALFFL